MAKEISPLKYEAFIFKLLEVNQSINLISREAEPEEIFAKHVYDSVKILDFIDFSDVKKILDIGSGGGIPGIPLAMELRNAEITLLDSTEKKMNAAMQIADKLNLCNVKTIVGRAEQKGHDMSLREKFDMVTARAVAGLPELLEYALPFVKIGGLFVAYKGRNYEEELSQSEKAFKTLGAKFSTIHKYNLPDDLGERVYIVFEKITHTPQKFPRNIGIPKKTPLK